jgi:sulfite exporter TauE/SafE
VTFVASIFVASLLGSVHCASMCGAFACMCTPRAPGGATRVHLAYQAGRLVAYVSLGAVAGLLGSGVNGAGAMIGIGRGAAIAGGAVMIAWAASRLASSSALRIASLPSWSARVVGQALLRAPARTPAGRAAATGLITSLIPCGWLYAFTATAATTGAALSGAAVMAVFWLGTVPALAAVAAGAQRLKLLSRGRLAALGTIAVLVMGVLSVAGRLAPPVLEPAPAHRVHAH